MTAQPTPTEAETLTTREVVYAGRRKLTGGKPGYWYVNASDLSDYGGMDKPFIPGHRIGTLVEIRETHEGRIIVRGPNGPTATGKADVEAEELIAWQLATGVIDADLAKAAAERRIAREVGRPLDEAIEPLREALNRLPWNQRHAAVSVILAKLLHG